MHSENNILFIIIRYEKGTVFILYAQKEEPFSERSDR